MPQLDPTWFPSQIFWLAIMFIATYLMLSKWALPPLLEVVQRRRETIDGDLAQAQTIKEQAEKARLDYERLMADARSKAQGLLAEAQAADKARAEKAMQDMNRQAEQKLEEANRKIAARKQELLAALAPSTQELSSLIAQKLIQGEPGEDTVRLAANLKTNR